MIRAEGFLVASASFQPLPKDSLNLRELPSKIGLDGSLADVHSTFNCTRHQRADNEALQREENNHGRHD